MKHKWFLLGLMSLALLGCNSNNSRNESTESPLQEKEAQSSTIFVTCTFSQSRNLITLSNKQGDYTLSIYLYRTPLKEGTYQVLGSDGETLLEGIVIRNGIEQDAKSTLFITYTGETISASGSAQLYEPNSVTKSGEVIDFVYEGPLTKE